METGDWTSGLKRIESELAALDAIPQLGSLPPFPYDALAESLGAQFNLPSLTLKEDGGRWASHQEALEGLGDPITHIALMAPPLEGELFFSLPTESLQHLMHALLGGDPYAAALYDSDLRDGFIHFLSAEVLKACQTLNYPIVPVLSSKKAPPHDPLFVRHITIEGLPSPISARLLLTESFCTTLRRAYEEKRAPLSPELAASLPITLSTFVGEAELSGEEWRELQEGDFVCLDTCTYDPKAQTGTAHLTLKDRPLFEGEIGTSGVTITGPS